MNKTYKSKRTIVICALLLALIISAFGVSGFIVLKDALGPPTERLEHDIVMNDKILFVFEKYAEDSSFIESQGYTFATKDLEETIPQNLLIKQLSPDITIELHDFATCHVDTTTQKCDRVSMIIYSNSVSIFAGAHCELYYSTKGLTLITHSDEEENEKEQHYYKQILERISEKEIMELIDMANNEIDKLYSSIV